MMEKIMFRMFNRLCLVTLCSIGLSAAASAQSNLTAKAGNAPAVTPVVESDRSRDGLIGPVRRVRTEIARLTAADGRQAESKPVVVEIVAYDIKGNKIENQYFPIAGATLTGKEVYKYEFDFLGNWNRMTTAVAVVDSRGVTFEPTEVTYRSIMYYLDENMVKMVQPGAATTPQPVAPVAANTVSKPAPGGPKSNTPANNRRDSKK